MSRNLLTPLSLMFCVLLATAHALRFGNIIEALTVVAALPMIFSRKAWCAEVLALLMLILSLFWLYTGGMFIDIRTSLGQPWIRLALIMTAVFGSSVAAFVMCCSDTGKKWFYREQGNSRYRASAFCLTFLLCLTARSKAPFDIFLADRFFAGADLLEILLLSYYSSWLVYKMSDPAGMRKIRPVIWLLFSLVFFSQFIFGIAGVDKMLMTGTLHLPVPALIAAGPVFRGGGYFMPVLFTASIFIVGPAWCSWLCYIGAWDDRLSRMSGKKYHPVKGWILWLRLVLLILVILAAYLMRILEVPGVLAFGAAALFGIAGIAVMLVFSRRLGVMVHCSTFCPMGIISNLLGKLSLWRIKINHECSHCGACSRVCRYSALSMRDIELGRPGISCTLCGDCVSACRHSSIDYHLPFLSAEISRMIFVVLVSSLHAVFLGIARI
jgi:ferredoxin